MGLTDNLNYKVFDESDGTEIDDDECLVEYAKLGGTIVIGVQWEPLATNVPTPVATTVSSFVATTAAASVAATTVPMTAATTVPTSLESWQVDDVFASMPNRQWTTDDDVLEFHGIGDDISLATTSAILCEEQGLVNPTYGDSTGERSDITITGKKEPSNLKRSIFEEILTERKKAKSDGKHISMAYKLVFKPIFSM